MNSQALRYDTDEKEMYQFACPNCWAVRTVTLTPGATRPMCECGSPLSVIGEVESQEEACQTAMQHRLWCAIYFLRNCNCGYGRRP